MKTRNLAKSLHTVTALRNVAIAFFPTVESDRYITPQEQATVAIDAASQWLGIADLPDSYDLKGKAAAAYLKLLMGGSQ